MMLTTGTINEDAPPTGLAARFGHTHPDHDNDDDVYQRELGTHDQPDGLFGNIQQQMMLAMGIQANHGFSGIGFFSAMVCTARAI